MNQQHMRAILDGIAPIIKQTIADAQRPLLDRIDALEKRQPEKGERGEPGERGADGIPGERGADGVNGVDGRDGAPGEPGKDGRDGKDAEPITQEQVDAALKGCIDLVNAAVAAHLDANPPPAGKDGRDGVDGKDGDPGERGEKGDPGLNGKDGVDGRDGLAGVPGRDGANGKDGADGRDGLGIDDFVVEHDGERTFKLAAVNGERRKEFGSFVLPVMIYRGIWREGEWQAGDVVTFGGSLFVARKDTATKPETADCDWQLAAKRGRDGRDGKPGDRGPKGEKGDRGDRGYGG